MTIILFIVILGILIFVHELGHFLFAKLFGIRVDEFGFGYPPKAFKLFSWKGTDFTMNWIPFGGFVRIFGQGIEEGEDLSEEDLSQSINAKPRWQQLLVMLGGIIFNVVFAAILFACLFANGNNFSSLEIPEKYESNIAFVVSSVQEGAPAENAGIHEGSQILSLSRDGNESTLNAFDSNQSEIISFISETLSQKKSLSLVLETEGKVSQHVIPAQNELTKIGIGIDRRSEVKLPFFASIYYGTKASFVAFADIGKGFIHLITGKISGDALSGPIGIAGQVGKAASIGFEYLVAFTALLSINLAVLNLVPFPALDGGRILIILIESVLRKNINPNIVGWINAIGFFVLIGLMIFVSVKDIINIF